MRRTRLKPMSVKRRRRNEEYRKVRDTVAERELCEAQVSGVCRIYGAHAHHILRRSQGGADTPENLAWLCAPCHEWTHQHPEWAKGVGLLRSRDDGA